MPIFPRTGPVTLRYPGRPQRRMRIVPREQRETLEQHEAAQAAIEFATLRRQYSETMSAAYLAARNAPDEEASQVIFDQATQAAYKLQTKNPRVQSAFSAHLEGTMAGWGERFARQAAGIKDKQSLQALQLNYDAAIDRGDEAEAVKMLEYRKVLDPENIPLYEQGQADTPFNISFTSASRQIDSGDPAQIRLGIEAIQGVPQKGLRKEQVAARNKLIKAGQGELESRQSDNYRAFYDRIFSMPLAEDQSPVAHAARMAEAIQALIEAEQSGVIGPQQAMTLRRALEAEDGRFANRMAKPDETIQAEFYDRLLTVRTDADVVELRKWMADNAAAFGEAYDTRVKELYAHKVRIHDDAIKAFVTLAATNLGLDAAGRTELTQWALAKAEAEPAIETGKLTELIAQQAVVQQAAREARETVLAGTVAATLGALQQKTRRVGAYGIPETILSRKKAIRFIVSEKRIWFDDRLRPEDRVRIKQMLDAHFPGPELLPPIPGVWPPGGTLPAKAGGPPPVPVGAGPGSWRRDLVGNWQWEPAETLPPLPVVETGADYDAVPSGTAYIAPDGTKRRKP